MMTDMIAKICLIVSLFTSMALTGCTNYGRLHRSNIIKYADVSFKMKVSDHENYRFRKAVLAFAERNQLRDGPIGIDADIFGSPNYEVQIIGPCEGAIDDIGPMIKYASSGFEDMADMLTSYRETAVCEPRQAVIDK